MKQGSLALTLADVLEALTGQRPPAAETLSVPGVVIDSRQAEQGVLFVALRGERLDGHDFVREAFTNGARFALVQREMPPDLPVLDVRRPLPALADIPTPLCLRVADTLAALQQVARFWRRQLTHLRVVGVTGSVGKSTTKELTAEVLARRFRTLKNPGNLNNEIGLPLTLLSARRDHERAVLEMGFYVPGEVAFLCEIAQPHIGVITNVGTVHAERAGSQEAIARGKAELVEALPEDGVAVLNHDDPWVRAMAAKTRARVFYYGLTPEADLWADGIEGLGLDGIRFRLHYRNETLHLRVPLLGRHSVQTALRAAAVGLVEGLDWQDIVEGLRSGQQLRLVAVRATNGALLLDDTYNAAPESTLAALNLLAEVQGKRRVAVLGDMLELGPYEREGHERVGVRAAEVADVLITVGERARLIAQAAQAAGMPPDRVVQFAEGQQVVPFLREFLSPEDVVLLKASHGMRLDRVVAALEAQA